MLHINELLDNGTIARTITEMKAAENFAALRHTDDH